MRPAPPSAWNLGYGHAVAALRASRAEPHVGEVGRPAMEPRHRTPHLVDGSAALAVLGAEI
jgi:hypothetical protein